MRRIIDKAKEAGITAVIASDLAVMNYCRKKGMELHISTQSNITNIETVELYADYADVVVMARELTLKQVGDIVKNIQRNHITGPSGNLVQVDFCPWCFVYGCFWKMLFEFTLIMLRQIVGLVSKIVVENIQLLIKRRELSSKSITNISCRQRIYVPLIFWTKSSKQA
jgi:hypothetical protein